MKELDVVVDIRPSTSTGELVVMKQKVAFNGEADLIGAPVETRVRFANRDGGQPWAPVGDARIIFHRRAQPLFDTLPEPGRLAVIKAVAPLRGMEPNDWPSVGAKLLEYGGRDTFVLDAGENLLLLLTPAEGKNVQISDIVPEGRLDQFNGVGEGVKQ